MITFSRKMFGVAIGKLFILKFCFLITTAQPSPWGDGTGKMGPGGFFTCIDSLRDANSSIPETLKSKLSKLISIFPILLVLAIIVSENLP